MCVRKLPLLVGPALLLLLSAACANRPPSLNCVAEPQSVREGTNITVRTNARDPNNDPLTYEWTATSAIRPNSVEFSARKVSGQGGTAVYDTSGLPPGRYTITASVRDRRNASTCSVFVDVNKNSQAPTVACEPSNVDVGEGQSTTLRVRASDPNNDSLSYAWSVDGSSVTNNQASFEFGTQGRSAGAHTARVTVTDSDGMSANCSFNVNVEGRTNRNPTVTLTLDSSEVYAGDRLGARAQASDPDGDSISYAWSVDGRSIPGSSSQVQINTSGLAGGRHSVMVTARDDRGGTGSDTKSASVREKIVISMNTTRPDNVAKARLDEIALKMQQNSQLRAIITGHTDDRGSEQANQRVGQRRADALKAYLVEEHSVDGGRIEARSSGESQPMSSNDTEEGRRENRRGEVELFVP